MAPVPGARRVPFSQGMHSGDARKTTGWRSRERPDLLTSADSSIHKVTQTDGGDRRESQQTAVLDGELAASCLKMSESREEIRRVTDNARLLSQELAGIVLITTPLRHGTTAWGRTLRWRRRARARRDSTLPLWPTECDPWRIVPLPALKMPGP